MWKKVLRHHKKDSAYLFYMHELNKYFIFMNKFDDRFMIKPLLALFKKLVFVVELKTFLSLFDQEIWIFDYSLA